MISPALDLCLTTADMHNSPANLAFLTWSTVSLQTAMGQPSLLFPLTINVPASPYPHFSLCSPFIATFSSSLCLYTANHTLYIYKCIFLHAIEEDRHVSDQLCHSLCSPELRKGNESSLSLSPSGPGAVVPRSKREVPLLVSGKRGNKDCMA